MKVTSDNGVRTPRFLERHNQGDHDQGVVCGGVNKMMEMGVACRGAVWDDF